MMRCEDPKQNAHEDVPEKERKEVAQSVADWVLDNLETAFAGESSTLVRKKGRCGAGCG